MRRSRWCSRRLRRRGRSLLVIPPYPQRGEAGIPVFGSLGCRDVARLLACGGLPSFCRRLGHFLLLAQEKVTTEMVAMPKERAPRMTRLPSFGRKVRGRVTGFFDRTSVSCRKTGRIPAATLRAFLHPPAAVIRGPRRAKSKSPSSRRFREHPPLTSALSRKGRGRSAAHRV